MSPDLDARSAHVLRALVDGYRAREGMKQRARALSEYELARRLGITQYTWAQFESSAEREELRQVLGRLVARGLAETGSRSGHYETFAPLVMPDACDPAPADAAPAETSLVTLLERISRQLDEALGLLRSIDRKLGVE
jgi:hypothetical protein